MSTGNINISAGILFSGNTFQCIKEIMNIANVAFISQSTFYFIQKKLLYPAIHWVYTTNRALLFESAKEESEIHLLGDGRCDYPGYNANYGTYTLMDSESGHILDFHMSHVRVPGNSQKMELDGFKRVANCLEKYGIKIGSITTDRCKQIRSYMRKFLKHILHQFDIWHVGKNIKKKIVKLPKKTSCCSLNQPIWWCCTSCEGDPENLKEKYTTLPIVIDGKDSKPLKNIYQHKKVIKKEWSCKAFLN